VRRRVDVRARGERRTERRGCGVARGDGVEGRCGRRRPVDVRGRAPLGDENPWGLPFFIVTHRPEEEPEGGAFTFVSGVKEAVERAVEAAGGKDVNVMGAADVIRQALAAGLIDELTIITAPVVLGGGKRLFEGFSRSLELEHLGVRPSQYGTVVDYRDLERV